MPPPPNLRPALPAPAGRPRRADRPRRAPPGRRAREGPRDQGCGTPRADIPRAPRTRRRGEPAPLAPGHAQGRAAPGPHPTAARGRRPCGSAEHDKIAVDGVEPLDPVVSHGDDVLDARAMTARQVDPRLDREAHPRFEERLVPGDDVGVLVLLEPDAMSRAVHEVVAVARSRDDLARGGVDALRRDPRPYR